MAWWNALVAPVAAVFTKALDIVDDMVPDKDLAEKLKTELSKQINEIAHTEFVEVIRGQVNVIVTEIGEHGSMWQKNWRPWLMCSFGLIIFNNYFMAPYINLWFGPGYAIALDLPPYMWELLKLGISGYVVGRTIEKIAGGDGLKSVVQKTLNGSREEK